MRRAAPGRGAEEPHGAAGAPAPAPAGRWAHAAGSGSSEPDSRTGHRRPLSRHPNAGAQPGCLGSVNVLLSVGKVLCLVCVGLFCFRPVSDLISGTVFDISSDSGLVFLSLFKRLYQR